jgi:antidote-toxin recognition MazE-like antitoxin
MQCNTSGTAPQALEPVGPGAERRQGLRPIQIWVPDVRSPAFTTEAHRQSLAVARSPHATEEQGFIDAVSE